MFWRSLVSCRRTRRFDPKGQAGFGLIELMVSVSIMVIVSSIILARQDAFNSAVLLRGEAYNIALRLREVQLSAVSASNEAGGTEFQNVFGVFFTSDPTATYPTNGQYQVFRESGTPDEQNYGYFNSGEEIAPLEVLDPRFEIREIRFGDEIAPNDYVSVVYERPNFDAQFFDDTSGSPVNVSVVEIDVSRKGTTGNGCGDVRTIEVTRTGQIAVKKCS